MLLAFITMAALRMQMRTLYFAAVVPFFLFRLSSSPNLSVRRLNVYHTTTHDVAVVRI